MTLDVQLEKEEAAPLPKRGVHGIIAPNVLLTDTTGANLLVARLGCQKQVRHFDQHSDQHMDLSILLDGNPRQSPGHESVRWDMAQNAV